MANALPLQARDYGFDRVPHGYSIRISPSSWVAFIAIFHAVAILFALLRTGLCLHVHRRLFVDDYLLLFALVCLCTTAGVAYTMKDLVYLQIEVGLGWRAPPPDFFERMLEFEKRVQVCSSLIWTAIYAVKFSFLVFFRKLVARVKFLGSWWWVVFGALTLGYLVSMPLAFIVCDNFSRNYMKYCPIKSQLHNEKIYLDVTTTFDVITDALIVSVPVMLLWDVRITLKKKLVVGAMCSLSLFMAIIAIIRASLAPLPNGVIDTSWIFFWTGIEAACAVIMVSLTSFRPLFGQQQKLSQAKKQHGFGSSGSESVKEILAQAKTSLDANYIELGAR